MYRIGGTRVTLDLVVRARGLPDVYRLIGYYLKHRAELAAYFEKREREEKELLDAHLDERSPRGLRERLLARRKNP